MKSDEYIKTLVLFRLETLSSNKSVSIGAYGSFKKQDLIDHVKKEDEIGKKIIDIELEFIRAMREGKFYE